MTQLLYYDDPMQQSCSATVLSGGESHQNQVQPITLDRSCFFPEGGGQPGDRGTIAGIPVLDTKKDHDGSVLHYLAHPLPGTVSPGSTVECVLDWPHRYDYMQQHTGQHVLSGALHQIARIATVSVHQGEQTVTIEVDTPTLTDQQLHQVEDEANRVIAQDLPVRAFTVRNEELNQYTLRRPTNRTGSVRLVEIEGYDLVACGGVHLPRTGLLNAVKLTGLESIRGRLRLAFKIGDRALRDYREKHRAITETAELYSCGTDQVPDRTRAMQEEVRNLHRTVRLRAERLAGYILPPGTGSHQAAALILENEDDDVFKALAEQATEDPARRLVLINRTGDTIQWAIIVGPEHPFPQNELRELVLAPSGAKGGGKPPLWRGVIPPPSLPAPQEGDTDSSGQNPMETFVREFQRLFEP